MKPWRLLKWSAVALAAVLGLGVAAAVAINVAPGSGAGSSSDAIFAEDDTLPEGDGSTLEDDDKEQPWLGIVGVPWPAGDGVAVIHVAEDSPADQAGLERGDVITLVDGEEVGGVGDIAKQLEDKSVGDAIDLTVVAHGICEPDGEATQLEVTLGARPDRVAPTTPLGEALDEIYPRIQDLFDRLLGGELSYLNEEDETITVAVDVGQIKNVSDDELTITRGSGEEKTFSITNDTHVPSDLSEDDRVIVISVNGEVRAVHAVGKFQLFGPGCPFHVEPPWFGPHELPFDGFDDWYGLLPCREWLEP